jgi:hypothetical protein
LEGHSTGFGIAKLFMQSGLLELTERMTHNLASYPDPGCVDAAGVDIFLPS